MNGSLREKKIGYGPLSSDLSEPGDRRRFCAWADNRRVPFAVADPNDWYDIVYLTYNCDIPRWINYKTKYGDRTRVIFELVDSYFFESWSLKSQLRGIGKFLCGNSSRFYWNYRTAIRQICQVADAVVCSTDEQKTYIKRWNKNVHISLDVFANEIASRKNEYTQGKRLKLVWEGQPYTAFNILIIKEILNRLADQVELHIVTDPFYYAYAKRFFCRKTLNIFKSVKCPIIFHEWKKESFVDMITQCDLAIIPIDPDDRLAMGKPENKLVLFWQIGIPTLTSATPAYTRMMNSAGIDMVCASLEQWEVKLLQFSYISVEERQRMADKTHEFASLTYSQDKVFLLWDQLFQSIL